MVQFSRTALAALLLPLAGTASAQIAPPTTPALPSAQGGGSMTLAQFQARQEQRIMAADTDGDGRISLAEYTAAMNGRGGGGGGGHDPAQGFARMDANHDGYLDKAEIDAAAAERFHRMDTNGDGVVTPDERMAAHGGGGGGGGHRHRGYGYGQPTQPATPGAAQPQS